MALADFGWMTGYTEVGDESDLSFRMADHSPRTFRSADIYNAVLRLSPGKLHLRGGDKLRANLEQD